MAERAPNRAAGGGNRTAVPHRWQVIVTNVGIVYDGPDKRDAMAAWNSYKSDSAHGYGRAAKERVCVMCDDHVFRNFDPREAE